MPNVWLVVSLVCLACEAAYLVYEDRQLNRKNWLERLECCRAFDRGEIDHTPVHFALGMAWYGPTLIEPIIFLRRGGVVQVQFDNWQGRMAGLAAEYAAATHQVLVIEDWVLGERYICLRASESAEEFFLRLWPRPAGRPTV